MKKITFRIAAILLLCSVVFFACKKEEAPVPVPVPTCAELILPKALAFEAKADAFEKKITANPFSYTKAECSALRVEAVALIAEAKSCPAIAANVALIKELDDIVAKELICL